MNKSKICATCGTKYPIEYTDNKCLICEDERQYVPLDGQKWTTGYELGQNHSVQTNQIKPYLYELVVSPTFAIGQRAFLVLSQSGNVLWDCIPLLDEATTAFIKSKGGLKAIAFSHPHYYSNMNDWAQVFDCPIYIHENDAGHIVDKGEKIRLWQNGEMEVLDGINIVLVGGHFDGSSILHVPWLSEDGTILCGDTLYISPSLKHMAVMYSYPNRIPLPTREVMRIKERLEQIPFDSMYGFYSYQNVQGDAKEIARASLAKYID